MAISDGHKALELDGAACVGGTSRKDARTSRARCPACGFEEARIFLMAKTDLIRYACDSCGRSFLTSR